MATSPWRPRSFCSVKTCVTRPMSRRTVRRPLSDTAMPADSWPRCWRAKSAKYVSRATSRSGEWMPKTPHIRREPPGARRTLPGGSRNALFVGGADLGELEPEDPRSADRADALVRHPLQQRLFAKGAGDDCAAAAFPE